MSIREPSTPELLEQTFNETLTNFIELDQAGALAELRRDRVEYGTDVTEHKSGVITFPHYPRIRNNPGDFRDKLGLLGLTSNVRISVIRGVAGTAMHTPVIKFGSCPETDDPNEEYPSYVILNHDLGRNLAANAGQDYPLDVPEIGSNEADFQRRPGIEGLRYRSPANLEGLESVQDLLGLSPFPINLAQATALKGLSSYLPVFKRAFQEQAGEQSPDN